MRYLLTVILLAPFALLAQQGFVITANITGLPDKAPVSLTDLNNPTDTLAKAEAKNGAFVLKGTIREPNLHQLNLGGVEKKTILFMGNDKMTIKGTAANVQQLDVKGSTTHADFITFQNTFNPLFRKLSEMNQQLSGNPDIKRDDSLMIRYQALISQIKGTIQQFVTDHKTSAVTPFMLVVTNELEQDLAGLEKRFNMLPKASQEGFYGKILSQQIGDGKIGAIGSEAADFIQVDTTGKPVSLTSFRGKYVLVDFWASWCRPCRMENPNVVAAYNRFKSKNFTVLGVSLDRSREPWIQAIKEDGLAWTQVSDLKFWNNEVAQKYKITSIPQNFLIDPTGKIVGKNLRGAALEEELCKLLGCN